MLSCRHDDLGVSDDPGDMISRKESNDRSLPQLDGKISTPVLVDYKLIYFLFNFVVIAVGPLAQPIYITFTDTEVNNCFSIYHTS